jgi:hypothetical protein
MEEKSGSQTSGKQPMDIVEDVPDPDEDDLDDLDGNNPNEVHQNEAD